MQKELMITNDNWQYTQYVCDQERAYISLHAFYKDEVITNYCVQTEDHKGEVISHQVHETLETALQSINSFYAKSMKWKCININSYQEKKASGCASCAAH
jgi:hypothetical protein